MYKYSFVVTTTFSPIKHDKLNILQNLIYIYIYIYNKNETKGYPTPCFMQLHKCSYNHQGINLIYIYILRFVIII